MRFLALALAATLPSIASAQDAAATGSQWASVLPLALIFFVFYFMLIRPQQKRLKEHAAMLDALKKGDSIVTGGGIMGKISKLDGDTATIEIAPGVEVKALRSTISSVVAKPGAAPVAGNTKKKDGIVKNDNVVVSKEDIANDN